MTAKKIAIIGGGLSGLLFAYYLSKIGHKVTLFEKESSLGGELATLEIGGTWPVEKYYHHLFSQSPETKELLSDLGIEEKLVFYKSKIGLIKNRRLYPFTSPKDLMNLDFLGFITKLRMGLSSVIISRIKKWQKIEGKTAEELIKKTMGINAWQEFWEPMFYHKFGKFSSNVSAVWFWSRLTERLNDRKNGERLGYLEGSFQVLIEALSIATKNNGGIIETNKTITNIVQKEKKFQIDNKFFDCVISAVPLPVFKKIAPNNSLPGTVEKIKHLSVMTLLLELKKPLTDYYWTNILDKDLPFVVMIEQTNLISAQKYNSHIVYLGRYLETENELHKKSEAEITSLFIAGLEKIFPGSKKEIIKSHLFRDEYAQPLIGINYQKPHFKTKISNLYWFSAAHIYPGDRGIENIIKSTKELVDLI